MHVIIDGYGVARDFDEALKWYRLGADRGGGSAQNNLGLMYQEGMGVEANQAEAAAWFRKAAEQGVAVAQWNLGDSYLAGRGVAKDTVEAVKWFRKAAEQGDLEAQAKLASLYAISQDLPKDEIEAAKWYRKALAQIRLIAESGDAQGMNNAAWILATCPVAEVRDGRSAVAWAERAVAATNRKDPGKLDTLAAAYAEVRDFAKAVAVQTEAMALLHTEQEKQDYASRLKLYESGSPYRERQ